MFVTFEGPDGAGKSTQAARLVGALRRVGREVTAVHEPGGTELGDAVRSILVRRAGPPIEPWAEAFLFAACRAQLVREVIQPALRRGDVVVADRFADSTRAYQGAGRGLDAGSLEHLIRLAVGDLEPDLTVLLDVPVNVGLARLRPALRRLALQPSGQSSFLEELALPADWNRFEDEAQSFHERVRAAYLGLARSAPARWFVVDATQAVDEVEGLIWAEVERRLPVPSS